MRELPAVLLKFVYSPRAGRLIELMRDEVDWTLARAVGHST
jgi:hypothetical protein